MASIKVKFRPSTVADHEGTIYYQIIHERKVRQLLTEYKVFPIEWEENRSMVTTTQKSERKSFILSIRERIRWDKERLIKIDRKLDANGLSYTADDVIDEFNRYAHEYSLFNFMESIIAKLKQNGKIRTSETYKSTLNSFKKFRQDEDIMLDCLTSEIMEAYEAWHHKRGVAPNTISFYTRILRAVYNRAVEDDFIENRNPGLNERCTYRNTGYNINHSLKRIAGMVGVTIPLTLYVARHSWASAAKAKGIPLSVISEGMGHDSEATTQIYLASLDTSVVDKANSLILKSLK